MVAQTARQRQKDETHRRLFRAACELFAARGYHGTTVESIAKAAGVAKGTFFVHFATRDAVIVELVRGQVKAARRRREETLEKTGSPTAALRATVVTLGREAGRSRELSRAVLAAGLTNDVIAGDTNALFGELQELMTSDAQRAIDQGELGPRASADMVASTVMASYLGAALHFTSSRHSPPIDAVLERFVDANIAGFSAAETQS